MQHSSHQWNCDPPLVHRSVVTDVSRRWCDDCRGAFLRILVSLDDLGNLMKFVLKRHYPLVNKQKAIENGHRNSWFIDLPIKNGDFPQLCKRLPEGKSYLRHLEFYEKLKIWWREIHGWTWEGKHQHGCPQDRSLQHDHHRRRGYSMLQQQKYHSNTESNIYISNHINQTHAFSFSLLDCMPIQVCGN